MSQLMSLPLKNEKFTASYFARARMEAAIEAKQQVQAERKRAAARAKRAKQKKA